jgi:putative transposase
MWNLSPPPNFQGLRPDRTLQIYERHLPHWRQEGATYFVTFRLADSLPQAKLHELNNWRQEWERLHPPPRSNDLLEELTRETMERIERWLDQGMGSCVLKEPANAEVLVGALHYFDIPSELSSRMAFPGRRSLAKSTASEGRPTARYELGCYVVMPNHVHAIVRPLDERAKPLEAIVGSWKQFSARRFNRARGAKGDIWQEETFDRIIRDEEHLWRAIQYIGRNPDLANLSPDAYTLWVRPEWEALGWTFESRRS